MIYLCPECDAELVLNEDDGLYYCEASNNEHGPYPEDQLQDILTFSNNDRDIERQAEIDIQIIKNHLIDCDFDKAQGIVQRYLNKIKNDGLGLDIQIFNVFDNSCQYKAFYRNNELKVYEIDDLNVDINLSLEEGDFLNDLNDYYNNYRTLEAQNKPYDIYLLSDDILFNDKLLDRLQTKYNIFEDNFEDQISDIDKYYASIKSKLLIINISSKQDVDITDAKFEIRRFANLRKKYGNKNILLINSEGFPNNETINNLIAKDNAIILKETILDVDEIENRVNACFSLNNGKFTDRNTLFNEVYNADNDIYLKFLQKSSMNNLEFEELKSDIQKQKQLMELYLVNYGENLSLRHYTNLNSLDFLINDLKKTENDYDEDFNDDMEVLFDNNQRIRNIYRDEFVFIDKTGEENENGGYVELKSCVGKQIENIKKRKSVFRKLKEIKKDLEIYDVNELKNILKEYNRKCIDFYVQKMCENEEILFNKIKTHEHPCAEWYSRYYKSIIERQKENYQLLQKCDLKYQEIEKKNILQFSCIKPFEREISQINEFIETILELKKDYEKIGNNIVANNSTFQNQKDIDSYKYKYEKLQKKLDKTGYSNFINELRTPDSIQQFYNKRSDFEDRAHKLKPEFDRLQEIEDKIDLDFDTINSIQEAWALFTEYKDILTDVKEKLDINNLGKINNNKLKYASDLRRFSDLINRKNQTFENKKTNEIKNGIKDEIVNIDKELYKILQKAPDINEIKRLRYLVNLQFDNYNKFREEFNSLIRILKINDEKSLIDIVHKYKDGVASQIAKEANDLYSDIEKTLNNANIKHESIPYATCAKFITQIDKLIVIYTDNKLLIDKFPEKFIKFKGKEQLTQMKNYIQKLII